MLRDVKVPSQQPKRRRKVQCAFPLDESGDVPQSSPGSSHPQRCGEHVLTLFCSTSWSWHWNSIWLGGRPWTHKTISKLAGHIRLFTLKLLLCCPRSCHSVGIILSLGFFWSYPTLASWQQLAISVGSLLWHQHRSFSPGCPLVLKARIDLRNMSHLSSGPGSVDQVRSQWCPINWISHVETHQGRQSLPQIILHCLESASWIILNLPESSWILGIFKNCFRDPLQPSSNLLDFNLRHVSIHCLDHRLRNFHDLLLGERDQVSGLSG